MSEQAPEQNPAQAVQPGAEDTTAQAQPQPQGSDDSPQTFPLSLVKRPTGDVHWNTAKGIWETITHAETGEPTQEYALVTTIDGQEVTLDTFNASQLDTRAANLKAASG